MTEGPDTPPRLPECVIGIDPPDLGDWLAGNGGIPGVLTFESGRPGPHVALTALMHGNEYSGAIVLDRLLREGVRPRTGRLSFAFLNLTAFHRFDPTRPTESRFVDEDMNRVWDEGVLASARRSVELDRARELLPWIGTIDVLIDLHSMLWPSDPVILCGASERGRRLAERLGGPALIVADRGHDNGRRLIDHPRFTDPAGGAAGVLVEAGEHWEPATVTVAMDCVIGGLLSFGVIDASPFGPVPDPGPRRFARVTDVITAGQARFSFVQPFRGGAVIAERNTLLALDGEREVRTPYDACLLVLPSLRPARGHTAVRLARFEGGG